MKMTSLTIFKKEIKDIIRDRKTLLYMILFPIFLMPIIFFASSIVMKTQIKKEAEKEIRIALINTNKTHEQEVVKLKKLFTDEKQYSIVENIDSDNIEQLINSDSINIALEFEEKFSEKIINGNSKALITLSYKAKGLKLNIKKTKTIIDLYSDSILNERLIAMNINKNQLSPIEIIENDIISQKESFGQYAGGILSYFLIIFCLTGAMYPGIDLGAGEKERGTLETLLVSPASHLQILLGKFFAIFTFSILSGLLSIAGLFASLYIFPDLPKDILSVVSSILEIKTVVLMILLFIPTAAMFSAIILTLSIYSKTYKEAQSIMSPLIFVCLIPAMLSMIPSFELNTTNALIPIFNITLGAKDVLAGTITNLLFLEIFLSSFLFAILSLLICKHAFKSETVIFRS